MDDRIPMLPPKVFWDLIDAAKNPDRQEFLRSLHRQLVVLSLEEIVGFDTRLWHYLGEANRRDLWTATRLPVGGCSDDGFRYFGCWLIAQGRLVFEKALADADSLAELPPAERYNLELILSSATQVWTEKTGQDWSAWSEAKENAEKAPWPELAEPDWNVNDPDELRKRWPRLTASQLPEPEDLDEEEDEPT